MKLNFEVFTETTYESTKMIEGVLYEMRVFAVNAIGISQPSMNTKPFMPIGNALDPSRRPALTTMASDLQTDTTLVPDNPSLLFPLVISITLVLRLPAHRDPLP